MNGVAEPVGPPNGARDAGFQGERVGAPSVTSAFGVLAIATGPLPCEDLPLSSERSTTLRLLSGPWLVRLCWLLGQCLCLPGYSEDTNTPRRSLWFWFG